MILHKKTISFLLTFILVFLSVTAICAHTTYANDDRNHNENKKDDKKEDKKKETVNTTVSGVVRESNGKKAIGATVIVTCNHNGLLTTHTAVTSKEGKYSVIFDPIRCKNGDTLSVTAAGGNDQGSNNGNVNGRNGVVNVVLVDSVASVPEFGLITGLLATATSIGGYFIVKRRTS